VRGGQTCKGCADRIPTPEEQEARELTSLRQRLAQQRTKTINKIRVLHRPLHTGQLVLHVLKQDATMRAGTPASSIVALEDCAGGGDAAADDDVFGTC